MLKILRTYHINFITRKLFHTSSKCFEKHPEHPLERTFRVLINDLRKPFMTPKARAELIEGIPRHSDIVIIGGGAIGSSIAYWLKEKSNEDSFRVVVIEKDLTYSKCSTALSVGGLRQQFSLPENIQMSVFGADFLRSLKRRFGPNADVNFTPHGYLVLASEEGAEQLIDNSKLQKEYGAVNLILHKHQLKDRFPWLNVDSVELGCLGIEKEGWFDPWSLLQLFKTGAAKKGTYYLNAEAVDFNFVSRHDFIIDNLSNEVYQQPNQVVVQTPDGNTHTINFALCIVAAGADSADIVKHLKIGTGPGLLSIPLPVERRKRYVFSFACQGYCPGLNTPMTIDPSGAYFRRDGFGGTFIGGISPEPADEPETSNLDVNHEFFDTHLWPILAKRVDAFNAVKVKTAWSGFYEYNTFDENGIVGPHPYYNNIYLATGFSGHGIQQAPAVGRAIAELILDGRFETIDLTRLCFDRLLLDKPMYEARII